MHINLHFKLLLLLFFILSKNPLSAQSPDDWKFRTQESFLTLLNTQEQKNLGKLHIQLWTVSPGVTVTTAFGHSAFRIYEGKEYGDTDYYLDFGVYEPTPGFLFDFVMGKANFFVNIIPTSSAYQTWDSVARGIQVTELTLTEKQKHEMLAEILSVYEKNKKGYYYDPFTSNCVTFLRDIISKVAGERLELKTIDAEKNTQRRRVIPYSSTIVWLNLNEALLYDKDTDIARNSHDLVFLPDDLLKAVQGSTLATTETKILLRDRWGDKSGNSGAVWRILFAIIIIFSLPFPLLKLFERFSEVTFSLVSGIGGTIATMVYFFSSFGFMDQTISWLIFSPIDFIFLKKYENWKNKKTLWMLVGLRVFMIFLAFVLRLTIYQQQIDMILFLSAYFFLFFLIKKRKEIIPIFKTKP